MEAETVAATDSGGMQNERGVERETTLGVTASVRKTEGQANNSVSLPVSYAYGIYCITTDAGFVILSGFLYEVFMRNLKFRGELSGNSTEGASVLTLSCKGKERLIRWAERYEALWNEKTALYFLCQAMARVIEPLLSALDVEVKRIHEIVRISDVDRLVGSLMRGDPQIAANLNFSSELGLIIAKKIAGTLGAEDCHRVLCGRGWGGALTEEIQAWRDEQVEWDEYSEIKLDQKFELGLKPDEFAEAATIKYPRCLVFTDEANVPSLKLGVLSVELSHNQLGLETRYRWKFDTVELGPRITAAVLERTDYPIFTQHERERLRYIVMN